MQRTNFPLGINKSVYSILFFFTCHHSSEWFLWRWRQRDVIAPVTRCCVCLVINRLINVSVRRSGGVAAAACSSGGTGNSTRAAAPLERRLLPEMFGKLTERCLTPLGRQLAGRSFNDKVGGSIPRLGLVGVSLSKALNP